MIFAAGNEGEYDRTSCTIGSPAIAKNVLAVGATVSGETRFSVTASLYPETEDVGMDTVAYFSSYGPTADGRIKPEVLAPGDMVSASPMLAVMTSACVLTRVKSVEGYGPQSFF